MKLKKNTKRYSKLIMLSVLTVLLVGCTQTSERKVVDRLVKKYNPNFIEFVDLNDSSYTSQFVLEDSTDDTNDYWKRFMKLQDEKFSSYFGKTVNLYSYTVNGFQYKEKSYDNVGITYYVCEGTVIGGIIDIPQEPETLYLSLDLKTVDEKK